MIELTKQDLLAVLEAVNYRKLSLSWDKRFGQVVQNLDSISDRLSDIIVMMDDFDITVIDFDFNDDD